MFIKQKSKINNKLERRKRPKKKKTKWDESSSSEDEEKIKKGKVANYALIAFNDEVIEIPLIYFEIT